jgi:predicted RNA-binding Zn ribbon-like protein
MSGRATKQDYWNDGFLFLGNQPVLDLLNTRHVQNDEVVELLPDVKSLLRWFQASGLLSARDAARLRQQWEGSEHAGRVLNEIRTVRERLRKDVLVWEQGGAIRRSTIEVLNRLLASHPMRIRLKARQNTLSKELWFDPEQPEDLFAPLAHSAAALFSEVSRVRVRKCEQCMLHFHDTSKKGTRRWCSMQLCGNRRKVAAYAARQRVGE